MQITAVGNKENQTGHTIPKTERRKEYGQNLSGSKTKNLSVYDDGNIPEVDLPLPDDSTQDVIPDEVPRKDGPGGENSNKNND